MARLRDYAEKGFKIAEKSNPEAWHLLVKTHECPGCGELFVSSRPHAITCSARCRKRLSRMNKANVTL